jgi:hypothetical protein
MILSINNKKHKGGTMSAIYSVQASDPSSITQGLYDPEQKKFLDELTVFEAALKALEANPNDPVLAQKLQAAGKDLFGIMEKLKHGTAADKAMAAAFEKDIPPNLGRLLTDCVTGTSIDVQTDLKVIIHNGEWNQTLAGLETFHNAYPNIIC